MFFLRLKFQSTGIKEKVNPKPFLTHCYIKLSENTSVHGECDLQLGLTVEAKASFSLFHQHLQRRTNAMVMNSSSRAEQGWFFCGHSQSLSRALCGIRWKMELPLVASGLNRHHILTPNTVTASQLVFGKET